MAPNFTHSIFDPLSCTGTQWIGDKVSPLSTFPGHPGFITSIRLLLSSCLSMYNIQSALSSTFRGLCKPKSYIQLIKVFFNKATAVKSVFKWGTLYTLRKPPRHLLATGVPSCEEPGSAHEQTCKISREELPHPIKQGRDELRKKKFFVSLPLWWRLLISVDSCAEWGWPYILGTIQGGGCIIRPPCLYVDL